MLLISQFKVLSKGYFGRRTANLATFSDMDRKYDFWPKLFLYRIRQKEEEKIGIVPYLKPDNFH